MSPQPRADFHHEPPCDKHAHAKKREVPAFPIPRRDHEPRGRSSPKNAKADPHGDEQLDHPRHGETADKASAASRRLEAPYKARLERVSDRRNDPLKRNVLF